MAHSRKKIRDNVKTLLTGQTSAGDNVFTSRGRDADESELPCIIIYTPEESKIPRSVQAKQYIRNLEVWVEIRVQATDGVDDILDDLTDCVERLLVDNPDIINSNLGLQLTNTLTEVDESGKIPYGAGTVIFQCTYIK